LKATWPRPLLNNWLPPVLWLKQTAALWLETPEPKKLSGNFLAAIDGKHIKENRVYVDKGSASNANRQYQRKHTIKRAIMRERIRTNHSRQAKAGESIDQQKTAIMPNKIPVRPTAYSE
jgi:hypothetical protein